jgi:flagellar hook-associated protein 3 FlgL
VQYDKSNFKKGDVNPTMYFDCVDNVTGVTYVKKDEDIEYNINFTQKLKVNTQADEAFNIYFGRNIDDLTSAVQNVLDIESQMSKVESMMKEERYSSDADQQNLSDILEGLTKQQELAKSQMTKAFESGIGQMQGYQEHSVLLM